MIIKIGLIFLITIVCIGLYILTTRNLILKVSEAQKQAMLQASREYKPSMTFTEASDYLDKLILDEYTLKYQLNVFLKGRQFLHTYDKEEVAKELSQFAGDIAKMISEPMQRELEYYYHREELERLIVRRCNLLLMTYVEQKKQERAGATVVRG